MKVEREMNLMDVKILSDSQHYLKTNLQAAHCENSLDDNRKIKWLSRFSHNSAWDSKADTVSDMVCPNLVGVASELAFSWQKKKKKRHLTLLLMLTPRTCLPKST